MISTAAAPSVICDELPAVTTPSGLNAGLRLARRLERRARRMPSSSVCIASVYELAGLLVVRLGPHGDDLVVEAALVGGPRGPLLRSSAERVELLTGDVPLLGDHLGRDALRHEAADAGVALGISVGRTGSRRP